MALWAEYPKDIRFNLTVRYRDNLDQIYMLRVPFNVDGEHLQELCVEGLKVKRGFPAYMEPYVD